MFVIKAVKVNQYYAGTESRKQKHPSAFMKQKWLPGQINGKPYDTVVAARKAIQRLMISIEAANADSFLGELIPVEFRNDSVEVIRCPKCSCRKEMGHYKSCSKYIPVIKEPDLVKLNQSKADFLAIVERFRQSNHRTAAAVSQLDDIVRRANQMRTLYSI
jgi:hypothetical protein